MSNSFTRKRAGAVERFVSGALAVTTTVWLSGASLLVPLSASAQTIVDGDLIRASNDFKVYIVKTVGAEKFRRWFVGPQMFNFYLHLGFSKVKVVSPETLASYEESWLTRAAGDTKVYWVDPATAQAGVGATKRWVTTAEEFASRGYKWNAVYVVNTAERDFYTTGTDLGPGGTTGPAGTLAASLASDTPASTTIPQNAARVGFTKLMLNASGGDAVIDSITVKRTGASANANFSEIILLDNSDNDTQIGSAKTLSSNDDTVFNDDITIKAGTKYISVAANMASTLNAAEVARLEVTAVTMKSGTLSATFPIAGNAMTMNATLTIGTATVAAGGLDPSATTQRVGKTDYIFSSFKVTAGSAEDVEVSQITWFENGTAGDDDVQNLRLLQDGSTELGTVTKPTAKYVTYNLSPKVKIPKGENREFSIKGNILSGSSRTVDFVIEKSTHLVVKGLKYGYFITPTYPNAADPRFNPADTTTIGTGTLTFSKDPLSSLNVASGGSGQVLGKFKTVVEGEAINVTRLVIYATSSRAMTNLTNLTIYDSSGAAVVGPIDPTVRVTGSFDGRATSTDTVVFPVGSAVYTIKGNLSTTYANNDTVQVGVAAPAATVTAKGSVTNNTLTPNPTTDVTTDTVTVKAANLKVTTNATPAAQTVIVGTTNFNFAEWTFDASDAGEDVRITAIKPKATVGTANTEDDVVNQQLFLVSGGTETALQPIVQPTEGTATTTFTLSTPLVITKSTTVVIRLRGDMTANAGTSQTYAFGISGQTGVVAIGNVTASTVTPTVTDSAGSTMTTASTGSFTVADDASNPTTSGLAVSGQTGFTLGELRFTATNEDVDITELHVTTTTQNTGVTRNQVGKMYLVVDGVTKAEVIPTSTEASTPVTFVMTQGTIRVLKGSTGLKVTLKGDWNQIGTNLPAVAGRGIATSVANDAYAGVGVQSATKIAAGSKSGTYTGQGFLLFKSLPTISFPNPVTGSVPSGGTVAFFRFTVSAGTTGDIGVYKFNFAISTTSATVTSFQLFETPGASELGLWNNANREPQRIYTAMSGGRGGIYGFSSASGSAASSSLFDTGTDGVTQGGEFRSIAVGASKVFELRGSFGGAHELDPSGRPLSQVTVELLGDNAFPSSSYPLSASVAVAGPTSGIANPDDNRDSDFIWSDLNVGNNSSTATQTAEWTNGFRVPGLNINTSTSQGLN
ncbi:hypothetical protein HYW67_01360 [Candidatus Parcubacteria bacterium]|nr:hypothetical protein [Candidatus Parcubacteria bacterium]